MLEHSTRRAIGPWRHWTFAVWVIATVAIAAYVALAAPFAEYFGQDFQYVALVVPPLSFILLATGVWWLIWLVTSSPRRRDDEPTARERRVEPGPPTARRR